MTPKQLVRELCKREGKMKQVNVAQMTETVGHLADLITEMDHEGIAAFSAMIIMLGMQRKISARSVRATPKKRKKARRK